MEISAGSPAVVVRPYRSVDRQRVREVSCATSFAGAVAGRGVMDRELLADVLTRYYTDREPDAIFVAEVGGTVAGYIMGTRSTRRFRFGVLRLHLLRTIPKLLGGGYRMSPADCLHLVRHLFWGVAGILAGERDPELDDRFPAHLHINIDPAYQQAGIGSQLMAAWLSSMERRKVPGVHLSTTSRNEGARKFFGKWGFTLFHRRRSSLWSHVSGRQVFGEIWVKRPPLDRKG